MYNKRASQAWWWREGGTQYGNYVGHDFGFKVADFRMCQPIDGSKSLTIVKL